MHRRSFLRTATAALSAGAVAAVRPAAAATPDHLAVARDVILAWRRKDLEGMLEHIDDAIVWHSHVGSPPIVGKPAMREFATKLTAQMAEIRWRIFAAAQNGDLLHLEGVDDYTAPDGRRVVIPYAGIMAVREGRVAEWRDYFDRALFDRLKAGEALPAYLEELVNRPALF